tara:strand:- start:12116 stop:13120 length:1005 start_codon:yes stop_codon:yes gene_type:complete
MTTKLTKLFTYTIIGVFALIFALLFLIRATAFINTKYFSYEPTTGEYISINNERIYVQQKGTLNDKPTFVFIHGTGSWSQLWMPTMEKVSNLGFHSVAIDLPPFGYSRTIDNEAIEFGRFKQAERIINVLNQLNINNIILVGHSFGGQATLTTATKMPDRVKGLILVNVALGFGIQDDMTTIPPPPTWLKLALQQAQIRKTMAAIGIFPPLTKFLVSSFVYNTESVTAKITKMYQKPLKTKGKILYIGDWLRHFILSDDNHLTANANQYQTFDFKTNIIWGDKDTITPLWQAEAIRNLIPNSRIMTIQNAGHIPMIESEQQYLNKITELAIQMS